MGRTGGILLTGATGFLGRYLLRELTAHGQLVAVIVRDSHSGTAEERLRTLIDSWGISHVPQLVVLAGDIRAANLGLGPADRAWIARRCTSVVHSAASVNFRSTADGDPWATNVEGTARLLEWCASVGLREFHHISTAFVCGDRGGRILEGDLECGQGFHNDYERSKFEAERRVRSAPGMRATIYRPSVIVGDSRTGAASPFQGFYRFPEAVDRLASAPDASGRRILPLRLPLDGEEKRHLVPVDWVAQAVARIVQQPALQGRTYHLVAAEPVPVSRIKAAAEEILQIDGVSFSGRRKLTDPSTLEELFLSRLAEYEPYLRGDPDFDSKNTRAALADLPAPCVDRACLVRLLRYAKAANWGKSKRKPRHGWSSRCAQYVEEFFPEAARRSVLASLPLDVTVRLEITEGGRWLYRWVAGALTSVVRDGSEPAEVTYQLDLTTFENVTSGLVSPQDAFATQDIAIKGDIEKGLKLAVLFSQFVKEFPYPKDAHLEDSHAVALVP